MYCKICGGFFGGFYEDLGEIQEVKEDFVAYMGKWASKVGIYFTCNNCIDDEIKANTPSDEEIHLDALFMASIKNNTQDRE